MRNDQRLTAYRIRQQRGIALIMVLTMLSLLMTLAANYVLTVSRDTESIDTLNSRIQARYSALSGIQYGLFAILDRDKELRWRTDGKLYSVSLAGGEIFVRILPESGRVDINRAHPQLMTLLFQYAGLGKAEATQLTNNVMHWRNATDVAVNDSVQDADYETVGLNVPAHRRFYTIEEITQVYGLTPQIYQKIKPLITVYGTSLINGFSAPDEVFRMLELSESDIAQIHSAKAAYYADENATLTEVFSLSPLMNFTSRASYYRVMAYAQTSTGQVEAVYSIIKNQRSNDGSFREMMRETLRGDERKAFIQMIKATQAEGASS